MAAAVRLLPLFFFPLLISSVKIGVRATRPAPQDPPPSAAATASTSVAAMHEARNLQDVSLLMRECLREQRIMYVCGGICFDIFVCVSVVAAMHDVFNLKLFSRQHPVSQAKLR